MSAVSQQQGLRGAGRREPVEVHEPKREDQSLILLSKLRRQRVERCEQERRVAREDWRAKRHELREAKLRRRAAQQEARDYWKQARAQFFSMFMTTGEYKKAKAIYKRMNDHAVQLYLECQEAVTSCKSARAAYFDAGEKLKEAQRQQEKLEILRQEIRVQNMKGEF